MHARAECHIGKKQTSSFRSLTTPAMPTNFYDIFHIIETSLRFIANFRTPGC
jgi:hypothetical protein